MKCNTSNHQSHLLDAVLAVTSIHSMLQIMVEELYVLEHCKLSRVQLAAVQVCAAAGTYRLQTEPSIGTVALEASFTHTVLQA